MAAALPLLACSLPAQATEPAPQDPAPETPATAKKLLEKVVAWQGGRKSLEAVRFLSISSLNITVHGKDGTNEASVRKLRYQLSHEGQAAKLAFTLDAAGSSRSMGFDGRRYWVRKPNWAEYISDQREDEAADIERMRDALDVLSTLFVTSLMQDGEPFEWTGRIQRSTAEGWHHIFRKSDHKGRKLSLVVRTDGSIVRASRDKKFPSEDREGKPTFVKAQVVVVPSEFVEVDPPESAGTGASKVRLPTKVEIQINSKPWITVRIPGDDPCTFREIAERYFKLK